MTALAGGLRGYAAVTGAYWAFMLTDGALRMLVLLHFYELGFTPLQLAWLFLLYEVAGIVTNLSAGWLAARYGLALTLHAGLGLQIAALAALTMLDPGWSLAASVVFVMAVQGVSGVAKDLAKTASKSAVKLLVPEGGLFRWVAVLTGSKNAVKGAGFFVGAGLLAGVGFEAALWAMAAGLAAIWIGVTLFLPSGLRRGTAGVPFRAVFSDDVRVNRLSAARLFLFAARDVWFVVALPIWLRGWAEPRVGQEAAFLAVGAFMATWIIGYGAVQAGAPALVRRWADELGAARTWVAGLAALTATLAAAVAYAPGAAVPVLGGLMLFGAVFAVNSAVHSYLILHFAGAERVTMDVGFYYMANAGGRLLGTFLSGLAFQTGGLALALGLSAALAALSWSCLRTIPGARRSDA